jgi:DNA-binding beta-propeller fold protein YncE
VARNSSKSPLFTLQERMEMLQEVCAPYANVEIDAFEGLLVGYAMQRGATVIVKGLRAVSDFEYELQMASMNRRLASGVETMFLMTGAEYSYLSSNIVKEIARLGVGKQPHGIAWSPDGKTLFVGHERDTYIARFEAATWRPLPPLMVGVPQHVLTIAPSRPNELWFTLTNTTQGDVLRVYDLQTNKITPIKIGDVHDAYFTPDESEVWSSSSGFLDKPSDRMVIYDPATKTVKKEIHLPGTYPFHTEKVDQDGVFFMADRSLMVLSDHLGPGLLWVDWKERRVVSETKLGQQPFHTTYDPEGDRLLTTTNVDGMVNVIDVKTRAVVQKVSVPKAHGIGAVPIGLP